MKIRPTLSLATLALVSILAVPEPIQARELLFGGALWEKSIKAKRGQPKGCVYLTVTALRSATYSRAVLTVNFKTLATDRRYATATLRFVPWSAKGNDFLLDDEYGDVVEACLPPGRFAITGITYSMGEPSVGPYSAQWQENFQPMAFDVQEGKDHYLGNFQVQPGNPQVLRVRDQLARDGALITQHAKTAPAGAMERLPLDARGNPWISIE